MMLALALAGAVSALSCQINDQLIVVRAPGAEWKNGNVPLDAEDKPKFTFTITPGVNDQAVVKTATPALSISGSWPTLEIGPGQYGFVAPAQSCLFTEKFCVSMVQVSAMPGGGAAVSVMVTGSSKTEGQALRDHLNLIFLGSCVAAAGESAK
jgi:hypothetical protein